MADQEPYDPFAGVEGVYRLEDPEADYELARYRSACFPRGVKGLFVGHLVPLGFDSYCRVLPPLQGPGPNNRWPWWKLLEVLNATTEPGNFVPKLHNALPGETLPSLKIEPLVGSLDQDTMGYLLENFTAWTPAEMECLFYFWSGTDLRSREEIERVNHALRIGLDPGPIARHKVYRAELQAVDRFVVKGWSSPESPTAFWPEDMTWLFALHTDAIAAYVGGPQGLIDAIVNDRRLESTHVSVETDVDDWTDSLPM